MWWILLIIALFVGYYGINRFRNWAKWKVGDEGRITEEKTLDEWVALINGAASQKDKTMEKLAKAIRDEKIPNISVSKREVKLGGDPRPFLVIEHSYLKGYTMYVAALAYGEDRLNVVWYLVLDTPEIAAARRNARRGTGSPMGQDFFNSILAGGMNRVLNMSILDKLELSNYVGLVHQVVVATTKDLMKENNMDWAKINTATTGFLKLS